MIRLIDTSKGNIIFDIEEVSAIGIVSVKLGGALTNRVPRYEIGNQKGRLIFSKFELDVLAFYFRSELYAYGGE